ncbi:MAG: PAS domain S-box protein [Methanoregula sp.]|jgi:PAS domain S-box-containing protein|nr:PAS domain S-box protein [Methanoregula sp.]
MFSVLYVDDERDLLELGKLFLEQSQEFRVVTAASAREALELLTTLSCNAIVSDFQMPGMNGIEFLKTVRQRYGNIPFILFTGRGREEIVIEAINNGADFYLQKGGDATSQFAELSHKIRQATARRNAEISLIESEKRLADIIDFLPDATFAIDRDGIIIAWNRAIEEMTGLSAEVMIGKGDHEYAIPFYGERRPILIDMIFMSDQEIEPYYLNILRKDNTLMAETNLPFPKGTRKTVTAKAGPLYNQQGELVGFIEAIRDITESKKAEDELRAAYEQISASEEELREQIEVIAETEKKYRDLFENSAIGIFRITPEGKFAAINTRFARIAGYESTQEMMEAIHDIRTQLYVNPDDCDRIVHTLKTVGFVKDFRIRYYNRNRLPFWVMINATAVRNPQGTIQYYEGSIEDITEQIKTEEALVREKKFSSAVINSVPGMLYVYDSEGRLVRWNRAHETMTGYSAEELNNMSLLDWYKGDDKAITTISAGVERALKEGYARAEADLQTKSGKKIPFLFTAQRLEIDGKIYFTGIGIDISDRKKAEDELRAAFEHLTASEEELRGQYEILAQGERNVRESECKFRAIFESSPDALMLHDGGKLIDCNRHMLDLFGFDSLGELIDLYPADLSPEVQPDGSDSLAAAQAHIHAAYGKGEERFDWIHRKKDGMTFTAEVAITTLDLCGKTLLQTSIRDISQRKQSENVLLERERRLREAQEMAHLGFWVWDVKTGKVEWSDEVFRIFGLDPEQFSPQIDSILALSPWADDHERDKELIQKAMMSREMGTYDQRFIRPDKSTGYYHSTFQGRYDNGGNLISIVGTVLDITDRKRVEVALLEKTEEINQYFLTSLDLFCIADTGGYFRRLNPEWERTLGYPLADLEGRCLLDFVHPDDILTTQNAMSQLDNQREGLNITNRFRHKDGTYRFIEWRAYPRGKQIYASARDITQRLESEARYRSVIEFSPFGMHFYEIQPDGSLIFTGANPAADTILGVNNRQYIGRTLEDAFPDLVSTEIPDNYRRIARNGGSWHTDRVIYENGAIHGAFSVSVFQIRPGAIAAAFFDIKEQKKTVEALRDSEAQYRSIIDNIQDGYLRLDPDGRITMASPSAARMFGSGSPDTMLGLSMAGFYQRTETHKYILDEIARHGFISDYEVDYLRTDGSHFWGSVNAHFLHDENGNVTGTEGIIHDITKHRSMEHAIREANRKLSLLNTITRHDVANQLTILQGFTQIALQNQGDPVTADYLTKILTAADTIARQIEFTRTYHELGVRDPSWTGVEAVINDVPRRVPIHFSKTCGGIEIFADPMLEQVFFNLFDNAVRHGGKVTEITVRCEREPDGLLLIVEDDGNGIPHGEKEKIFQHGFGKNTGLGLFLVREILSITGISIKETGIPGKGARFEMLVPRSAFRHSSTKAV